MKNYLFLLLVLCLSHKGASLKIYDDFEQGKAAAKSNHTKIFMFFDFYGSCNTCSRIRAYLTDRRIKNALRPYTVIHLMCDDRAKYNDTMTVGEHNSELQIRLTDYFSQLMFCVLDTNEQLLSPLLGYCKKEELLSFIENGY